MTLTTVFDLLGETMTELHITSYGDEHFDDVLKKAEYESKLSKQIVNAADIILRSDKMLGKDRIDKVVG